MASSQIAYAGSDVVVTLNVIDSTGTHQAATGLNASRLSSHPSAVPVVTNPNSEPGVYVLTWSSLSPATSEGDSIVALIEGSVGGTAFSTYAIPLKVVANERGTDNASTFDNTVDTVITDAASRTASQADVSLLATTADLAVVDGNVDAIKAKTDQLAFTVANQVDANSLTGGTSPADIYTYFTDGVREDAFKADTSTLATSAALSGVETKIDTIDTNVDSILVDTGTDIPASIAALNNFDPATDQVIVSTNNDKTGYALSSAANDAIGAAFLAYTLTKGSPGTIERAFWQSLKATQLTDGEVSGTPTASAFDTNLTAVSGAYDHLLLLFTSGSLAGEARPIDSYSSTNGRITLQEALTSAPSSADEFIIVPDHSHPVSEIVNDIFNESQSGYTTPGTFGYYIDAQISGISSGGGDASAANQTTIISHLTDIKGGTFSGSTDSLEAIRDRGDAAWTTGGGSGIYTLTVTVKDASDNLISGARVNIDGTTNTLASNAQGIVVFNLDAGSYTLVTSPPSGYQTPTSVSVTISDDDTAEIVLTAISESGEAGWLG